MTTANIATLQDILAPLAARLAEIQAEERTREREKDAIKADIRAAVEQAGPGTYGAHDNVVTIALNRRFNEQRALDLIPEALFEFVTYTDVRVDRKKLDALAPDISEAAFDTYEHRVTVKAAK